MSNVLHGKFIDNLYFESELTGEITYEIVVVVFWAKENDLFCLIANGITIFVSFSLI